MKKPPRAAFAPTRELYACNASLINDSVAQDGAAWVRHTLATGPELDIAVGSWTDPVVLPFLRGVERSFADCRAAGERPAAKEMLSERIVDHLRLGHDVLVDDDGFDRPLMPGALARLAYYSVSYGALMAKPYAQDALIDLARMSPPGDVIHYVAYGLALMTDVHPHFATPNDFATRDVCLVVPSALALGLEHLPAIGPAATTAPLDVAEENTDCEGVVRWRQNPPPPRPRPKAEPVAKAAPEPEPQAPGVVVFPADVAEAVGKGDNRREVERFLGKALGARLPLVPVPENWDCWEDVVNIESPWLAPLTRAVRLSQGNRTHWGHAVICAVGAPGSGKTFHARRIAQVSKLPFARVNCEATSDNAMGGSSIRWQTGHPSFVESLLAGEGKASGAALLDEIEKSAGGRRSNGGDPLDLLHGWFEIETARAWRSTYLLSEVDLSHVLFLCTANSLDGLPSSLVDRMTVVKVNEPGPEHLRHLAQILAFETCRQAGQDVGFGWLEDIEFSALADAWRGGSIRRLRRLVEMVLRARESGPAAMPRH